MTDFSTQATAVHSRLGVSARIDGGRFELDLWPRPETSHNGCVRASVLAYVVDVLTGLPVDDDPDVWTLTTDLSVRMRAVPAPERVTGTVDVLRRSKRSVTCRVDLLDGDGGRVGFGAAGFQKIPRKPGDPPKPRVTPEMAATLFTRDRVLDRPLREAAGITAVDPPAGVVEIAVQPTVTNPNGTLQGAIVALLAEAAAEDLCATRFGVPAVVTDLDLRYLARATTGPVRTSCTMLGDDVGSPIEVLLTDLSTGTVTTLALARATPVATP